MDHILVVDDNLPLAQCIRQALAEASLAATVAGTLAEAREQFQPEKYALVLLDLILPDGEGLDLCRELRARSGVPIIVISARGNGADRMLALEAGADMYLVKPFDVDELLARVRACLRLYRPQPEELLCCGNLLLDRHACHARAGDQDLAMTPKEFALLAELMENNGRVCTSQELLWMVWGYNGEVRTRTLDVHIGRLRAKLAASGARGCELITVNGVGYSLREAA